MFVKCVYLHLRQGDMCIFLSLFYFLPLQILLCINNLIFYVFVFNSSAYFARIDMLTMGLNICRFHLCASYFLYLNLFKRYVTLRTFFKL